MHLSKVTGGVIEGIKVTEVSEVNGVNEVNVGQCGSMGSVCYEDVVRIW